MAGTDNYRIQMQQAQQYFLTYDQQKLIQKLNLAHDEQWLYATMLCCPYRLNRRDGSLQRQCGGQWEDANTFGEVMTLLDLVCDSREDRHLAFRWKNMRDFGLMFHRSLLEESKDPWAHLFDADPEGFRRACLALGGKPFPQGDVAYAIEFFDGLPIVIQLWQGDEEFPASLRFLWDENALMYLRYETMYYAKGLLLQRLKELL